MQQSSQVVAIIPARGGSKSIPRKNIKLLNGIPLIAYSIAAGLQSKHIDRVIVSTDDKEIAAIAKKWGAEVPFLRPDSLAGDYVTDFPVYQHAVEWLEKEDKYHADIIVQLRPTSPFRPLDSVDKAIDVLIESKADSVRAITPAGENPFKMWKIKNDILQPLVPTGLVEQYNMPRQQLPATFWQTGHIEVIRYETIMELNSLTGNIIAPYIIEHEYAIDLDNERQWQFAEYVMKNWNLNIIKPLS